MAGALFAFSPMLFVYSLEVRMYMLLILVFVCLLVVHWAVAVEHREEKRLVATYAMLAALLFYVHYIAVFLLLGVFVHWATTTHLARARITRLCAAATLTLLLISPGVLTLVRQHAGKNQLSLALKRSQQNPSALSFANPEDPTESPGGAGSLVKSASAMAGFYPATPRPLLLLCAFPLAAALAVAGYLALARGDEICRLFLLTASATCVGALVLHSSKTRFLLPLVPLLALAVVRAVQFGWSKPRWRSVSVTIGALMLCIYAAGFLRQMSMPRGRPWQSLVSTLQQDSGPEDTVVFDASYAQVPFDYFARHAQFQPQEEGFPLSIYDWWNQQGFKGWGGPVILQSDLGRFASALSTSTPKTLWLVRYETNYYDPHDALLARLRQLGQVTEVRLPPDPGATDPQEALRLFRVSLGNDSRASQ